MQAMKWDHVINVWDLFHVHDAIGVARQYAGRHAGKDICLNLRCL